MLCFLTFSLFTFSPLNAYLTASDAFVVLLVVNRAELAGRYALDEVVRVYGERGFTRAFERRVVKFGGMADFERHADCCGTAPRVACKEIEAVHVEVFLYAVMGS